MRKKLHDNKKLATIAWQYYFAPVTGSNSIAREQSGGYITNPAPPPPTDPCASDPNYYSFVNQTIGPLLVTNWGQGTSYNNLVTTCTPCVKPLIGAATVAMGQIMRYYRYPASAYSNTYNYLLMPSTSGNIYHQELLTDIAYSISADPCNQGALPSEGYDHNTIGHSGTSVRIRISTSFRYSFSYTYADDADYYIGTDYSTTTSNIFAQKPVILTGYYDVTWAPGLFPVPGVGLSYWVCDGLSQSNITYCSNGASTTEQILYFHMNFGDNEVDATTSFTATGWYAFNDWTIPGLGGLGPTYYNEIVDNVYP